MGRYSVGASIYRVYIVDLNVHGSPNTVAHATSSASLIYSLTEKREVNPSSASTVEKRGRCF